MIMTLNEILTRQNLITKILLSHGDKELSKELKVKIMRMRMAYNKIKKQFDEESQEFSKQVVSDELRTLANKQDKTEEETAKFEKLSSKANAEYQEFLLQKGNENIEFIDSTFTEEEYADILDINSEGEYDINGHKIKAADLMEAFYGVYMN